MRTHTFTTDAARFPLHAVEPESLETFDLASIDFDRLEREWSVLTPEMEQQRDAFNASMGAARDRAKAAEWGCTIEELPWNAQSRRLREGEKRCG